MPATSTLSLLRAYAALAWKNQQSSGGQAEERLKAPVGALVGDFGQEVLGLAASTAAEYRCDSVPGRPDIGVEVDALPVGFVELKAPGKGAKVAAFKDKHDKDQWAKLRDTPNVLYTDGIEWGLYQLGECKLLIRLPDNVLQVGPEAITASHGAEIENLLRQFYGHEAVVPGSAPQLALVLAPLCRLLRDAVLAAVQRPESPLAQQAKDWRALLFSDADDHQFADSYAQTVTYGLLLARLSVQGRLDCRTAAKALEDSHGLLGRALKTLTDDDVEVPIQYPLRLLERAIGAVQPHKLYKAGSDPWLYFYEQFLEAYDRKLRNDRGVYYTPTEAVRAMVRLTEECLRLDLGLAGYADDSVVVLDPPPALAPFRWRLSIRQSPAWPSMAP